MRLDRRGTAITIQYEIWQCHYHHWLDKDTDDYPLARIIVRLTWDVPSGIDKVAHHEDSFIRLSCRSAIKISIRPKISSENALKTSTPILAYSSFRPWQTIFIPIFVFFTSIFALSWSFSSMILYMSYSATSALSSGSCVLIVFNISIQDNQVLHQMDFLGRSLATHALWAWDPTIDQHHSVTFTI